MTGPGTADPFDTAALRAGLLTAWRSSPTRLLEDTNSEADLVRSGYRDRVLTELAQNAADAAARTGIPGTLRVWRDGRRLHVANTGAPLDATGVEALTALRASAKTDGVGRFGVGFTAVLAISDDVEVRSTTGSIRFSAAATRDALAAHELPAPESGAPVLRLAWPSTTPPAPGSDTEVVLDLRDGIDARSLLADFRSEAVDLLLELPALVTVVVDGDELTRTELDLDSGLREIRVGNQRWWEQRGASARWLVPVVDDRVAPVQHDVLRAPTRSDEELSLPALVIGDVAMQPDRRRILPGTRVEHLAHGYARFVAAMPPARRADLVPAPGFARGEVDARLREAVLADLRAHPWLPAADGGDDLLPDRAALLPGLDAALATALTDVVPGLIDPRLGGTRHVAALTAAGVHRIGLARVAELLTGHDREPRWWYRLYEALAPLVTDPVAAEELASLPVPLTDGRTVTGPRTTVLASDVRGLGDASLPWVRLVHPDAAHPLLTRLGAGTATAEDLLADPALLAAVDRVDGDDPDPEGAAQVADVVLRLAAQVAPSAVPRELGALPLPDVDGELVPADELLLPGAPLADVLVDDSPFATLSSDHVDRYGVDALRAVGVGWGFTVLHVEMPTGPDHELPDEDDWWATLADDPDVLVAVRDLDLVADDRWPEALSLLAADPDTASALADRDGYTAWWLRTHAVLGDQRLGLLRHADDDVFAGLLDPCTHPDAGVFRQCLASDVVDDPELAELLLDRLGDPDREPEPAPVVAAHTALARAAAGGTVDTDDLILPSGVRSLAGTVADAGDALVVDTAWIGAAVPADRVVVGELAVAGALADLLDLARASSEVHGEPVSVGRATTWRREPAAVLAAASAGVPLPTAPLTVHERLVVRCSGAVDGDVDVPWWTDGSGTVHCSPAGLAVAVVALARP